MRTYELSEDNTIDGLINAVQADNNPLIVSEDGAECFIAMQPAAFEHILFGTAVLNCTDRSVMRL